MPKIQNCGIITTLKSSFIGLAYEGISSFLQNKRNKALHQAINAIDTKADIQGNRLMHLENSMLIYGVYNAETLEKLRLYITYTILLPHMKGYLWGNTALLCFKHSMHIL